MLNSLTSAADPLVTIAIPTFNRSAWVQDCVLSALAQTYEHFEVVVSDNASTDATQDVLKEFQDVRLRVVRQPINIGLIGNWNACLAAASGEFIVFVSDDDRIAPQMLEQCVSLVRREPAIRMVMALVDTNLVSKGYRIPAIPNPVLETGVYDGVHILREFLRGRVPAQMCSTLIKTNALRALGGLPTDFPYAGDLASWVPILMQGRSGFLNEACATQSVHDGRQTFNFNFDIRLQDDRKILSLISAMADQHITNPQERYNFKLDAKRFFARTILWTVASYRKAGTRLADILPVIWPWRRDLLSIGAKELFGLARPIAILLLPSRVSAWVARLRLSGALPS